MSSFAPSGAYHADRDIRLGAAPTPSWAQALVAGRDPNAACWLVVMPRRAGKTWLAAGLVDVRAAGSTLRIDLRDSQTTIRKAGLGCLLGDDDNPEIACDVLIIDEPGFGGVVDAGAGPCVVAEGLRRLRGAGVIPVVLATPFEHALLIRELGVDAPKDVLLPPALSDVEVDRMTARQPEWALDVARAVRTLEPAWLETPFLLELVLHVAEEHPELRVNTGLLLEAAMDTAVSRHEYLAQFFGNGLSADQRADLRRQRWERAGVTVPEAGALRLLTDTRVRQDPVVERHLPEVLRIHHITDLHYGGWLRTSVDAKDNSAAGQRIAAVAGAGSPLDSYLEHVEQLASRDLAPHLAIVTGDLVNRPSHEFGAKALAWLARLEAALAPHRDLEQDDPRIVLTGGNHDVAWDLCLDSRPEARHMWFAETFGRYPHPELHRPRHGDRTVFVKYVRAGLRVALLGSAESGGEVARDEDRTLMDAYREAFTSIEDEHAIGELILELQRIDPGVVMRGILDRLAPEAGYVTLAAIHHPLSPLPSVEIAPYAGIVNAGQVKLALTQAHAALVLHGHAHLTCFSAERFLAQGAPWTLRIAGAASLASAASNEPNGYNEVFVSREGGHHSLAMRPVRYDGGRWKPGSTVAFRPGAPAEEAMTQLVADHALGLGI